MEYITKGTDWANIRADKLVDKNWELIEHLAAADGVVRLFDKHKNGTADKTAWAGVDYEPLLNGIWREVTIHAHHQQSCKN